MLKRFTQMSPGIVSLCFAGVVWYGAVQEGILTLFGVLNLIGGAFAVDAAVSFFRGDPSSSHAK